MWLHLLAKTNTSKVQKIVFFLLGIVHLGISLLPCKGHFCEGNFTVANHIIARPFHLSRQSASLSSEKTSKITLENGVGHFGTDLGSKCLGKFIFCDVSPP